MAPYTPEFLRTLRRRYENTDQLMSSIAAEFEIGTRTLQRMVMTEGWRKRSLRPRGLPIAVSLLEQAQALGMEQPQPGHSRASGNPVIAEAKSESPGVLDPRLRGDDASESASAPNALLAPSPVDRIEALVVQQIEAEEAARAQLIGKRRVVGASQRSAHTLATLTRTLHVLERIRAGQSLEPETFNDDDDMPFDIDEFRIDLARRIDAFVASRTGAADADGDSGAAAVDDAG